MPPRDRGQRRPHGPPGQEANEQLPWAIVYYQAPDGTVLALEFLDRWISTPPPLYPRMVFIWPGFLEGVSLGTMSATLSAQGPH